VRTGAPVPNATASEESAVIADEAFRAQSVGRTETCARRASSYPHDESNMLERERHRRRMPQGVRRIAHLSDVHMLEEKPNPSTVHNLSLKFLSFGRPLDARGRVNKLRRALASAKRAGADHFIVSGDLTEVGAPAQFEAFAGVLSEAAIQPDRVTLVPGNHDAYTSGDAWRRALEGPLRPYARGAAFEPGKVVDHGNVVFLPVDVSCFQSIARSAGELTAQAADVLTARLSDPYFQGKSVVIVQHHPPFARGVMQWIDGLRGYARLMDLLARHVHVQLLHGHLHHVVDRIVGLGTGRSRIFGAPATVEDREGVPRVRLYEVHDGVLEAAGMCPVM
jgi:Icc protein